MEAEIGAALLPYIFNAISVAYKISERAVDDVQTRLRGADKAVIAKEVCRLLPDQIGNHDITLVKRPVSPERFIQLTQDVFDRFDRSSWNTKPALMSFMKRGRKRTPPKGKRQSWFG